MLAVVARAGLAGCLGGAPAGRLRAVRRARRSRRADPARGAARPGPARGAGRRSTRRSPCRRSCPSSARLRELARGRLPRARASSARGAALALGLLAVGALWFPVVGHYSFTVWRRRPAHLRGHAGARGGRRVARALWLARVRVCRRSRRGVSPRARSAVSWTAMNDPAARASAREAGRRSRARASGSASSTRRSARSTAPTARS